LWGGRIAVADPGFPIVCDADTAQRCMALHASGDVVQAPYLCFLSRSRSLARFPPSPSRLQVSPLFNLQLPPLRTKRNQAAACSSTDPPPLQLFLLLTPASPLPHRFPTASSSVSSPKNTPLNRVAPTKFRLSICFQICPRFLPSRFDQISLLCKAANSCCFGATLISGGPPIPWNRQFGNVSSRYGTT